MNKFIKCTICILFVLVFALLAVVPAVAVDIAYIDEHGAEGEELWEDYKMALKTVRLDDNKDAVDRINSLSEKYHASYYEKIIGRPQDEFISLSNYDKVLLASTLIEPYYMSDLGQTYNSEQEWTYATDTFTMFFEKYFRDDSETMNNLKLSYNKLMTWQYGYYQSSGAFYNFVEDMDSLDYLNEKYIEDMQKETEDSVSSTIASPSSKVTSSSPISSDNKRSIWGNVKDNVKTHIITIVLLLAFLIAGAVIAIRKKRVNAQDNDIQ